jgi:hypothetical protein
MTSSFYVRRRKRIRVCVANAYIYIYIGRGFVCRYTFYIPAHSRADGRSPVVGNALMSAWNIVSSDADQPHLSTALARYSAASCTHVAAKAERHRLSRNPHHSPGGASVALRRRSLLFKLFNNADGGRLLAIRRAPCVAFTRWRHWAGNFGRPADVISGMAAEGVT